jgi:hypothetical protein
MLPSIATKVENVWKVLKIQVQKRLREIKNANDLRRVVLDIWTDLGLHYIRSLYDSIPWRIRCVVRFVYLIYTMYFCYGYNFSFIMLYMYIDNIQTLARNEFEKWRR